MAFKVLTRTLVLQKSKQIRYQIPNFSTSICSNTTPLSNLFERDHGSWWGQSSLDYLFGSGGEPKPNVVSTCNVESPPTQVHVAATEPPPPPKTAAPITPPDIAKQIPAGIQSSKLNNYIRADGSSFDQGSCCSRWRVFLGIPVW